LNNVSVRIKGKGESPDGYDERSFGVESHEEISASYHDIRVAVLQERKMKGAGDPQPLMVIRIVEVR